MTIDERKSTMVNTNVVQNLILENRGKLNITKRNSRKEK